MAPPRRPSHLLRDLIIVLIVIVVFLGIALAAEYRSSTMIVTVMSNHVSNTIAYVLTLDGRQVDSGFLDPGRSVQDTLPLSWWVDNCQSHTVVATSTGGGFGPETDSASGIICNGVPATASLSV